MAKPIIVFASILLTIIGVILLVANVPLLANDGLNYALTHNPDYIIGTVFGALFLAAGITGFWMLRNRR